MTQQKFRAVRPRQSYRIPKGINGLWGQACRIEYPLNVYSLILSHNMIPPWLKAVCIQPCNEQRMCRLLFIRFTAWGKDECKNTASGRKKSHTNP
jgi:hypothetical protein